MVPLESISATRLQRIVFWVTCVFVALTRIAALSSTLWDWDESLFAAAVVEFDIAEHRPHPPGFPLYIGLAKLLRPLVSSEFEALRAINLVAALLLFPAAFALARSLRFDFTTSWLGGVLLSFLPNIWFFGGTAFSDVPAVVLAMGSAALLLRVRERQRGFISGCIVAASGMAIRPQNALMAAYPALAAIGELLRRRRVLTVVIGGLVTVVIGLVAFGMAVQATGSWERYRGAVEWHRGYIMTVDSYQSPSRPPLQKMLDDFYVDPLGPRPLGTAILILGGIGLFRGRRPVLETLAIFGPFALFALFILDHWSGNRFSIAYMPLFAFCAAEGARVLAAGAGRLLARMRHPIEHRTGMAMHTALIAIPAAALAIWAWPGIRTAASTASPSFAAVRWVQENIARGSTILVHSSMWAFSRNSLEDYVVIHSDDTALLPPGIASNRLWILSEGLPPSGDAVVFRRPRQPLVKIARDRYFEVHVRPATSNVSFGSGWYDEEHDGGTQWRWMGRESHVTLPSIEGDAVLSLEIYLPLDGLGAPPPVITLSLDGVPLDKFPGHESVIQRSYRIAESDSPRDLRITTDRTIVPRDRNLGEDARELGLQLRFIRWSMSDPE